MAVSIQAPLVHVEDANGLPYVGALQYVYEPNTTTLRPIFTDAGLSISAANPQTSNAKGDFPRVFTAEGTYKIRQEQKPIPPLTVGTLIAEWDDIDSGLSGGTVALPVVRGGTGATTPAAARANLGAASATEVSDLASQIATFTSALSNLAAFPQGRLTLTSGTPMLAASVSAASTVYYTPYTGQLCPVYDGVQFNLKIFAELSLTLNINHVLNSIYDVYVINDASHGIKLVTSPAWSNIAAGSGSRAGTCDIVRLNGLWVNATQLTMRNGSSTYTVDANKGTYVGSIYMDGVAGQVSCLLSYGQSRKWGVWNAYNRSLVTLKAGDAIASWSYSSATLRSSNNVAANSLTVFAGLPETQFDLSFIQKGMAANAGAATYTLLNAIGVNSTTVGSGLKGSNISATNSAVVNQTLNMIAKHVAAPAIGIQTISCLEAGNAGGGVTFYGTEEFMQLTAQWMT